LAALVGRVVLSLIFLFSGVMKLFHWSATTESMTKEGMVAVPFFLAMAILFELAGGLSLLLGFKSRYGALALIVFLIPVTLIFHDFWTYEGGQAMNQMQHFMKNLAIMGGLLVVVGLGPGPLSFDARRDRPGA
jgi:putative oxidoreductase